jgi:8-oxo-dGTP pyrophosphatase MutT (NUDIX family)
MASAGKSPPRQPIRQACAVPYRWRAGDLEFCLITSVRKGRWGFPKGIIDPGETPKDTALKEAWEEAGVLGRVEGKTLGQYADSKWGSQLSVSAYLMRVAKETDDWLEAPIRQRRWCGIDEARSKIGRKEHLELLQAALERLGADEMVAANRYQSR